MKFEGGASDLRGISPTGRTRFLASFPGDSVLHDVSRSGRVLLEKGIEQWKVLGRLRGDTAERDLSYLSATVPADLSADGTRFLFFEKAYGWGDATVYLRPAEGPPVQLGPGLPQSLSPDGKWVAAWPRFRVPEIVLLPTGAGQSRRLPNGNLKSIRAVRWRPDAKRVVFIGTETGDEARIYVQDIGGGLPKPITPARVANSSPAEGEAARSGNLRVSPDGKWVVARNAQRQTLRYPVEPGEPRLIPGIAPDEGFLQWSSDGRRLFVRKDDDVATSVFLHDIVSGERKLWQRFPHPDPTWGPPWRGGVIVTPDGRSWVRAYGKWSSNLFVLDGIQ